MESTVKMVIDHRSSSEVHLSHPDGWTDVIFNGLIRHRYPNGAGAYAVPLPYEPWNMPALPAPVKVHSEYDTLEVTEITRSKDGSASVTTTLQTAKPTASLPDEHLEDNKLALAQRKLIMFAKIMKARRGMQSVMV